MTEILEDGAADAALPGRNAGERDPARRAQGREESRRRGLTRRRLRTVAADRVERTRLALQVEGDGVQFQQCQALGFGQVGEIPEGSEESGDGFARGQGMRAAQPAQPDPAEQMGFKFLYPNDKFKITIKSEKPVLGYAVNTEQAGQLQGSQLIPRYQTYIKGVDWGLIKPVMVIEKATNTTAEFTLTDVAPLTYVIDGRWMGYDSNYDNTPPFTYEITIVKTGGPTQQNFDFAGGFRLFGSGWVEGAKSDIIGPGLTCLHRQMARIVTGDADDLVFADSRAGLGIGHIVLSDMDTVSTELGRQIGPVVEEERDAAALSNRYQHFHSAGDVVVRHILEAKL